MFVIGATNEHMVYAYSEKPFLIDEYFKIMDESNGNPIATVSSTHRYDSLTDAPNEIATYLKNALGKDIDSLYDFCVATLSTVEELVYPIKPKAELRTPSFEEIESILIYGKIDKNFLLGSIRGTERSFSSLPSPYDDKYMLYDGKNEEYYPQEGIPFLLNQHKFREYPHIGVFGGSGSGKTYALRVLCEEMLKYRIPGILLDPHFEMTFDNKNKSLKKDFREDFSGAFEVMTVGEDIGIDFTELSPSEIVTLLQFREKLSPTAPGIIHAVHERNDTFANFYKKISQLSEATHFIENVQNKRNEELDSNVLMTYERYKKSIPNHSAINALLWRISGLKAINIFNGNVNRVYDAILNRKLAVIRGRDLHVKMVSEYMIKRLYERRRKHKDWGEKNRGNLGNDIKMPDKFPPFMIIADEAHNYAPANSPEPNPLTSQLVLISQEARKYGVFLVLATQRPSSLHPTLFAQLNTKLIFRTTTKTDIDVMKTETNLSPSQTKRLPSLSSGNCFVSSPLLNETTPVKFRATKTVSPHSENPMDELNNFSDGLALRNALLDHMPIEDSNIPKFHGEINYKLGRRVSLNEIKDELDLMCRIGLVKKDENIFSVCYYLIRK